MHKQKSGPNETFSRPQYGVIFVAQEYVQWQRIILEKMRELYNKAENALPPNKELYEALKGIPELKNFLKKLMPFVQSIKESLDTKGEEAFALTLPYDEKETLLMNLKYIVHSLEVGFSALLIF